MRNVRLLAVLFTLACIGAWASPAHAYVCSRVPDPNGSPSGPATGWFQRTVPYSFNQAGTKQLTNDQAWGAIRKSFAVWTGNPPASGQTQGTPQVRANISGCTSGTTDMVFAEQAPTSQSFVGYNYLDPDSNENILIFQDANWTHPSTGDIIALTTTTYNALTGQIFDADVEFNSANYTFTVDPTNVQFDVMNTATHEIGHMLGFAHSLDANASMYASAPKGETSKEYLSCDDVAIMLFRYPSTDPNIGICNPPTDACGDCAGPDTNQFNASIVVEGSNDGRGGCQCSESGSASAASVLGWILTACLGRYLLRRSSCPQ